MNFRFHARLVLSGRRVAGCNTLSSERGAETGVDKLSRDGLHHSEVMESLIIQLISLPLIVATVAEM